MNRKDFRPYNNDDKNDFSSTKNNAHYKNGLLHDDNTENKKSNKVPSYLKISQNDYNKVLKHYNGDKQKTDYTIMRAESGHDNIASKELLEIKNPNWKDKVKPKGKYILARKMIDDDGKEKYFTYYPSETHGKAPYIYDTKAQADKVYARQKFPSNQSNTKVVKSERVKYLDRY